MGLQEMEPWRSEEETEVEVRGWSDSEKDLQAKECGQPLETEKQAV